MSNLPRDWSLLQRNNNFPKFRLDLFRLNAFLRLGIALMRIKYKREIPLALYIRLEYRALKCSPLSQNDFLSGDLLFAYKNYQK